MFIIAVDDEQPALNILQQVIIEAVKDCELIGFTNPLKALEHAGKERVDVAFLDVQMCGIDGLELAGQLKKLQPKTNIIFVTGHSDYMEFAFSMHVSGYILKLAEAEQIAAEIENLRYPVQKKNNGIWVQTFGNFEVFKNGEPIYFSRSKSKEILAYLIDRRGAGVTKKELAAVLWGDDVYTRSRQNYLHNLISGMMMSLKYAGASQMVVKKRNLYAVCPSEINCDYYNYLKWDVQAVNSFRGEYMTNYSWAEFTLGTLESRVN